MEPSFSYLPITSKKVYGIGPQLTEQHHEIWSATDASGQPSNRQRSQDRKDLLRQDHRQREDGEAPVRHVSVENKNKTARGGSFKQSNIYIKYIFCAD